MKDYNRSHTLHLEGAYKKPSCQAPGCDVKCNAAFACRQQRLLGLNSKIPWPLIVFGAFIVGGLLFALVT